MQGVPRPKLQALRPDFLIIAPPKTGTTWLAVNLCCHPEIFVPPVKELKYFSSFLDVLDLNWYLNHFESAAGRVKGEATPSYSLLPVERIQRLRDLLPDVKLIFLMRDPIARAWSHAKHNHRYREANFAACTAAPEAVTEDAWRENFAHDWPFASGDYLGQLRRWLSVFPREQLFIGFYEWIAKHPEAMLRDIFAFLGVNPNVDLATFRLAERILAGPVGELSPTLRQSLHGMLHARTEELASFLRGTLNLEPPLEWAATLAPYDGPRVPTPSWEFDDQGLCRVLEYEEASPSARYPILDGYRGYDIVHHQGRLQAVARASHPVPAGTSDREELGRFIATSLEDVKEQVDQHVFEQTRLELHAVELLRIELHDAREQIAGLERSLAETAGTMRRLEADLARRQPWYIGVARALRGQSRRWRAALRARLFGAAAAPPRQAA